MRGHEPVLAMRRVGAAPKCVWVMDVPAYGPLTCPRRGWQLDTNHAQVEVLFTDSPRRLDMRFTAGLTVYTQSLDAKRLAGMEQSAIACGAARVLGALLRINPRGDHETVEMTDTDGVVVWKA